MKFSIYGWEILKKFFPKISFSNSDLTEILVKSFESKSGDQINIIFSTQEDIQKLNKDFRNKNSVTDVLSFVIEEEPLVGDIYICPEYISFKYDENEVLRDIVHGYLHICGEDHKREFSEGDEQMEEMFVKQEDILQNIQYEINNRSGKSRKRV